MFADTFLLLQSIEYTACTAYDVCTWLTFVYYTVFPWIEAFPE